MKRISLLVLLVIILCSGTALAAGSFFQTGIRGNGGPQIGVLYLGLGDLNGALQDYGFAPLSDWVIMYGGGGIGGMLSGVRVGGYGEGGDIVSLAADGSKACLSMGLGGCVVEQGVYADGNTDIALGGVFGGGGVSLELRPDGAAGPAETFSKGFVLLEPRVNLHHQLSFGVGLECVASYLLTYDFNEQWQIGDQVVAGPFHFNGGPQVSLRLTFGF